MENRNQKGAKKALINLEEHFESVWSPTYYATYATTNNKAVKLQERNAVYIYNL